LLRAIADLDEHTGRGVSRCPALLASAGPGLAAFGGLGGAESHWWGECVGEHFETAINAAWLKQLGLPEEALDWQVSRCSTGERQRLALLRTLMQNPAALLLDEPTGNLDQDSTLRVEELLADYRRQRQSACSG
jgi:putative ABC transport system ATP-binding protein